MQHPQLELILELGAIAEKIMLQYRRGLSHVSTTAKGQKDIVTEADQAVEQALRARIQQSYPDHEIWGEEAGSTGNSEWSLL